MNAYVKLLNGNKNSTKDCCFTKWSRHVKSNFLISFKKTPKTIKMPNLKKYQCSNWDKLTLKNWRSKFGNTQRTRFHYARRKFERYNRLNENRFWLLKITWRLKSLQVQLSLKLKDLRILISRNLHLSRLLMHFTQNNWLSIETRLKSHVLFILCLSACSI